MLVGEIFFFAFKLSFPSWINFIISGLYDEIQHCPISRTARCFSRPSLDFKDRKIHPANVSYVKTACIVCHAMGPPMEQGQAAVPQVGKLSVFLQFASNTVQFPLMVLLDEFEILINLLNFILKLRYYNISCNLCKLSWFILFQLFVDCWFFFLFFFYHN